jgi:hypothetical protein
MGYYSIIYNNLQLSYDILVISHLRYLRCTSKRIQMGTPDMDHGSWGSFQ